MKLSKFEKFHPLVNFMYFTAVIGFSIMCMNPIFLVVSLVSSLIYSTVLGNKNRGYVIFIILLTAMINPLFNHQGMTVLTYLPDGNPLTLEAIVYGIASSIMIVSVISWSSCFSTVITSDKLMHLFGRIIPSFALIFSMTLRFVPRFIKQLKAVYNAQKTMGKSSENSGIIPRIKDGISVISTVISWSFENSIDTSSSMKARGYGVTRRTSFSVFKLSACDIVTILSILALCVYIIIAFILKKINFNYFPSISVVEFTPYTISVYMAFLLFCLIPVITEICEVIKWKSLKRKI